ncbi:MAG: MoxR family ATPase [Calditrichaeota bacterium]|nr:MoxR family ATPase [Calditrichota bacterium]MCB0306081.1 MoxR family ATPase [Calditrichota bacterium]MCB9090799.1 MoxR family ATPase [Calditrichia bacterium]
MDEQNLFANRLDLSQLTESVAQIRSEIHKIIVGQEAMIDMLIVALLADGHVLIEGVPGVAKTLTAKLLARTLSIGFSRIQFTPDLMPSDVLGTSVYNLQQSRFEFKRGPVFSNLILIDEINRAPAKTQSALFEVMEERQATVDGTTYPMAAPFFVLATQNPIEQEGTYRLPEAQLDRFLLKINVPYPDLEQEQQVLQEFHDRKNINDLKRIRPVLQEAQINALKALVRQIHIEENLLAYIARLVHHTRNHSALYLGGSPRASLAILTCAQAHAAINGRDFVTPEDIQAVLYPVLRHRLLLTPEKEMEGATTDAVIQQIIEKIEVPR